MPSLQPSSAGPARLQAARNWNSKMKWNSWTCLPPSRVPACARPPTNSPTSRQPSAYCSPCPLPQPRSAMEDLNDDAPAGPSVSKEPEKGPFYDAEPEEDLDVSGAQNQLWLVKVPKFLYDAWAQVQTGGQLLGTVRLYDPEPGSAKTEMELLLPTEPAAAVPLPPSALVREPTLAHIPRQYNLRLTDQHNMGARNIFAFKEKRPDEDVAAEKERRARKARRKAEGKEVADTSESDEESESEDEDVLPLQTGGQPIVKKRKKHSKFRRMYCSVAFAPMGILRQDQVTRRS